MYYVYVYIGTYKSTSSLNLNKTLACSVRTTLDILAKSSSTFNINNFPLHQMHTVFLKSLYFWKALLVFKMLQESLLFCSNRYYSGSLGIWSQNHSRATPIDHKMQQMFRNWGLYLVLFCGGGSCIS